ncbi:MAG TPA: hypothetical protein VGS19_35470, partial [Streptosporangiaceae bacterium]|nr:hypothetical protein [Streptosporangiaceae bacterium]
MSGRVRAWQGAVRRMGVVVTAAGLLAATATTGLAQAASHGGHRGTPPRPLFHQADVKTAHQHRAVRYPRVPTWQPTATHWPAPATGTAVLASSPAPLAPGARWAVVKAPWSLGAQARAGATPVWAQPLASGVAAVRVRVLPHSVAVAAGVRGVVFTAQASVGGQGGEVRVGLDYAGFAQAYGGD